MEGIFKIKEKGGINNIKKKTFFNYINIFHLLTKTFLKNLYLKNVFSNNKKNLVTKV